MARHHRRVECPHARTDAGVRLQTPLCQGAEDAELGGSPATASAEHEGGPDPRRRAATHLHTVTRRDPRVCPLSNGCVAGGRIGPPPARGGSLGLVASLSRLGLGLARETNQKIAAMMTISTTM